MASTTDKTAHSTKQIVSLMNTNLMDVPDKSFKDHTEVDATCVQALLGKYPGWVFKAAGPVSVNHNLGVLPWNFGQEGKEPLVRGTDITVIAGRDEDVVFVDGGGY
ncbi:uncharacterized protein K444DRAFT_667920 [Hyaloscypha bicolor E]|uniref:Uncharacterized protein n=1 Tax=Hyaloscypha bicolor E TaxID=1095630 RepID=A0A2J6SS86_9HELO|nr:uncharacterized protein K444DRAFT_667920 [Hyaloscypha bicolor E]PMD53627.1 hypothetical protein K444DRAFT_667920 [Hyaloscypha bicolor E]